MRQLLRKAEQQLYKEDTAEAVNGQCIILDKTSRGET